MRWPGDQNPGQRRKGSRRLWLRFSKTGPNSSSIITSADCVSRSVGEMIAKELLPVGHEDRSKVAAQVRDRLQT